MEQLSIHFKSYGVNAEQACIMCHLSSECGGCCAKCSNNTCGGQVCSQSGKDTDGNRWDAWMHLVSTYKELNRVAMNVLTPEQRKRYGIKRFKPKVIKS
ncbi:MAG: hypothetical protein IKZ92_00120 [Muribaculaceae bacterium]|nr:hypothetical protein [Muribaculaceae bacterium]